jgi:hypothetical protein
MSEIVALRKENGKMFDAGRDAKSGRPSYTLEARTGPIHYKEEYKDTDPWLDLDETYCEESKAGLVYPKMPNIVTVFQDRCGYQIQSRSNPDHIARVELVSIDGQNVTAWQDSATLKVYARVHPYRVGIWKDFSGASKAKSTTMRWRVTELGNAKKDSHPFAFRDQPEAYSIADLASLDPEAMKKAKVAIETARTRIDDTSWYWDELIPAEAKLVDTDWQVGVATDDGRWCGNSENPYTGYDLTIGQAGLLHYRNFYLFRSLGIQGGSTINSAYVTLRAKGKGYLPCYGRHTAKLAINPGPPTKQADVTPKTTAYVDWRRGSWFTNTNYNSPSHASIVQEVVNQSGFSTSSNILMFDYDNGSSNGYYVISYSYSNSSSYAPKLTVTWTEPTLRGHIYVPNVSWLSKSLLKRREI